MEGWSILRQFTWMVYRGPWTGGQCFVHHPSHEMAWWSKSVFQQKLWSLKIYNSVISISPAEFSIHHKRLSFFNICKICYRKWFQVQGCIYFNKEESASVYLWGLLFNFLVLCCQRKNLISFKIFKFSFFPVLLNLRYNQLVQTLWKKGSL